MDWHLLRLFVFLFWHLLVQFYFRQVPELRSGLYRLRGLLLLARISIGQLFLGFPIFLGQKLLRYQTGLGRKQDLRRLRRVRRGAYLLGRGGLTNLQLLCLLEQTTWSPVVCLGIELVLGLERERGLFLFCQEGWILSGYWLVGVRSGKARRLRLLMKLQSQGVVLVLGERA